MFIQPIKIGNLPLRTNIVYSPLAGCSDFPFRKIAAKFRPGLMFCEMVKMDALIRHDANTYRFLDYAEEMRPIGAQLCGSKVELAGPTAKIVENLGFDLIDLNCGCPVDKVTKDGSGSGLLKQPDKIGDILSAIVNAVKIPVTLKVRAGWDDQNINCAEVAEIARQAGAQAIFVHGRTRQQAYRGPANWDYIARVKKRVPDLPVFGNGDIFCTESAQDIVSQTACDGILLSRGILGSPWLAEDIEKRYSGQEIPDRSETFIHQVLLEHYSYVREYQEDRKALLDMRRVGCWYLKNRPFARTLREKINRAQTIAEVEAILLSVPQEQALL